MAVVTVGNGLYQGLSSDTKPTAPANIRFFETDTLDMFVSDGTYWWLSGFPSAYSTKKVGTFPWAASTTTGMGITTTLTAATGTGTVSFVVTDATNGRYQLFPTLTTIGNKGGLRINSAAFLYREWNPRMRFKFQIPASTDYTLARLFIGFGPNVEPTTDDPLNAAHGFYIGFISGGTNFIAIRNDGSGATNVADNVAASAQALDTAIHTVSIVCDNANSKFAVKWDNNAYKDFTTDIPATTQNLTLFLQNETNETAVAKNFRIYSFWIEADK